MQTKPAGWPADSAVEVVPDVVADFGSAVPGRVSVSEWSVDRQLTGSLLPGQVRGGTGFSVATGSVAFPQPSPPLSPWGKGSQKTVPGGVCQVWATYDESLTKLRLGSFIAEKVTGSVSDPAVHADLVEDQARLRRRVSVPGLSDIAGVTSADAVWLIDQIGRSGGYYATPPQTTNSTGALPLQGALVAEGGAVTISGTPVTGWQSVNGCVYPIMSGTGSITFGLKTPVLKNRVFLTANVRGKIQFTAGVITLTVDTTAKTIQAGTGTPVAFTTGGNPAWPDRVQIEAQALGVGTYTTIQARARSWHDGDSGSWSSWATQAVSIPQTEDTTFGAVTVSPMGGTLSGLLVSAFADADMWAPPTSFLDVTGVTLDAPTIPADADGWDTIQQIAAATLGGAWVSEAGVLTYRGRDWLRGNGPSSETIVSETSLEDVSWSIGGDDTADRVTVSYQPPDLKQVTDYSLTIWEATEAVEVPAGGTVTVNADIEGTARNLADWLPIWDTVTATAPRRSRWAAATSRDGGGTQPVDTALQVTATVVGTSRIRIRITNTTGTRLWTVDGAGNPTLIVRANTSARAGESVSISTGAQEDAATKPLTMDLGAWVQRYADAQTILDWVWSQVQEPRAVIEGVRVKPNLARQLGDIVRITDTTTGLSSKALVSGIHLSGSAGQYEQTVDLVLLDVTVYDLSQYLGAKTFAGLSADWAGLTFAQVTAIIQSIGA